MPSRGGVLEVAVDGELIHSKKATDTYPDPDEIVGLLEARTF